MKAFLTQLFIQFRCDLRDKGTIMVYYLVPLVFYLVMGSIMKAISMESKISLILTITVFAISMSAFLGMPQNLVKARENGVVEAYRAAGIPVWSVPLATIIISTLHIMIIAAIILATAPFLFSAELPTNLASHFGMVFLATLSSEALGTLVSCLVKKQNTMTLAAQCLFLPSIMFSGIMFPADLLPKPMQLIGTMLPASLAVKGDSIAVIALCGIIIIVFSTAAVLFRRISLRR